MFFFFAKQICQKSSLVMFQWPSIEIIVGSNAHCFQWPSIEIVVGSWLFIFH